VTRAQNFAALYVAECSVDVLVSMRTLTRIRVESRTCAKGGAVTYTGMPFLWLSSGANQSLSSSTAAFASDGALRRHYRQEPRKWCPNWCVDHAMLSYD